MEYLGNQGSGDWGIGQRVLGKHPDPFPENGNHRKRVYLL